MAQTSWPVEEFRELLDRILSKTGLSQGALAALVPMDQSQLSRWKSGGSRPKYDTLATFADAIERAHPDIGISKQEILSAGGYGDTFRASESDDLDRPDSTGERLKVIDGGRKDPAKYDEVAFFADIAAGESPPFPPFGLRPGDESEETIWALKELPPEVRWAAIRGKRAAQDDAFGRPRARYRAESDQPRESNGR